MALISKEDILEPWPRPYTGGIVSENQLDFFLKTATLNDKQPVVIFGANWCPDARVFSAVLNVPSVGEFIEKYYQILYLNVNNYEQNTNLMNYLGDENLKGLPLVLVFDKACKLLNLSQSREWRTARDRDPQDVLDYFQSLVR
ncbi:MAG: hypothetical protein HOD94_00460 [Rhodobacteraceae bacterium]|nr:hypothetical protein [Paracoccaceae bacterium]